MFASVIHEFSLLDEIEAIALGGSRSGTHFMKLLTMTFTCTAKNLFLRRNAERSWRNIALAWN